jgi:hypothetical protein
MISGGDSFSNFGNTMNTLGKIGGGLSSLGNLYLGYKSLDMAEDKLDMLKEQHEASMAELRHMQETRKRLTASYMGGSGSSLATKA